MAAKTEKPPSPTDGSQSDGHDRSRCGHERLSVGPCVGRRDVLKLVLAATTTSLAGCGSGKSSSSSDSMVLRTVDVTDAADLQAIMTSSVCEADSFFGECGEWTLGWAEELIARCPETVVLFRDDVMIAFMELPSIRAEVPPLAPDATEDDERRHAARVRNRTTFRVTAAGVRDDLLERDESVQVFLALLYQGFVRARGLGYEFVEAIAPWERHPRMTRKWTDYPGCELAEPVSYSQDGGTPLYWLRWRLEDAIQALADEGADQEAIDVRA